LILDEILLGIVVEKVLIRKKVIVKEYDSFYG